MQAEAACPKKKCSAPSCQHEKEDKGKCPGKDKGKQAGKDKNGKDKNGKDKCPATNQKPGKAAKASNLVKKATLTKETQPIMIKPVMMKVDCSGANVCSGGDACKSKDRQTI